MLSKIDIRVMSCIALIAGAFLFTFGEALLKYLTKLYTPYEIMLCRSLILVIMIVAYAASQNKLNQFKTANYKIHMLRAFFSALCFLFTTKALSGIPLYSYKSLYFLTPLFTALFGVVVFKENF